MFKIISTGWNCTEFITSTLASVESQARDDWEILIVDDASTDARMPALIKDWCDARDARWRYRLNTERLYTVRNQVEGIRLLDPGPDDVVIWLDPDGDTFAHPHVLDRLADVYADGQVLLTYGSYQPRSGERVHNPPSPFPPDVVARRGYRDEIRWVNNRFNHLRTMKGSVFNAIPENQFHWANGRWYEHGSDYIFMTAGLELADGRYRCIPEVLVIYNDTNPHADNRSHPNESARCTVDYLARPALSPLPLIVA